MTDPIPAGGSGLMSPEANRRLFDQIAGRYDLLNRLTSMGLDRWWRRKAVAAMAPRPGGRYLDIGCGTGDLAVEILCQCPTASVVGIDPAERMLEIARRKAAAKGLTDRIYFTAGDAAQLEFADDAFDGVVTGFCIRNVARRDKAVEQMRRVVAPGGRVVILELTVPTHRVIRAVHRFYTRRFVPLAGRWIARDRQAYQYLVDSVEDFPEPEAMLGMMQSAGLGDLGHTSLALGAVSIFVGHVPLIQ